MGSVMTSFPQLISYMFYTIKIEQFETFVVFAASFSLLSMVKQSVSQDKQLFEDKCINWKCLIVVCFRILDISHRVLIIVIIWHKFGGTILFIVAAIEFTMLFVIVAKWKTLSRFVHLCLQLIFQFSLFIFFFFF